MEPETQLAASMVEEIELVPSSQSISTTLKTWTLRWPHRGKKVAKVCHHSMKDTQTSASLLYHLHPKQAEDNQPTLLTIPYHYSFY